MKIRDVFDYVIELMEPAFSENILLRWLNQVEAEVQTEVLLIPISEITQYKKEDTTEETTTELIVPQPYDKLYAEYLIWRIELAQGEAERANNQKEVYEKAYLSYVRYVCDKKADNCRERR